MFYKYLGICKLDHLHMQQKDNRSMCMLSFGIKFSSLG